MKENSNDVLYSLPSINIVRQFIVPKSITGVFAGLWILFLTAIPAQALYITDNLEILRILGVGSSWTTVSTQNSYASPVIVCTYSLPSSSDHEAVVRIRNAGSAGFDVRIQRPLNSSSVTTSDVYCLVADAGDFTLPSPDGRVFEAHTVVSNGTNHSGRWQASRAENVTAALQGSYPSTSHPVVLGQVMTFSNTSPDFSAFWSFDCDNKSNPPFAANVADGICVGKHIGQTTGTRANETLGYIIIAEGSPSTSLSTGSFGGISYRVELGGDSIRGVGNGPPYTYALSSHYPFAVATQEAMDGGHGSWAVMYGTDPLNGNDIDLAVDEETVAGDTSRQHTTEQVAYWAFHGIDHGDAPSSYGDASHIITGLLSIGDSSAGDADAEPAQNSTAADADDTTTGVDVGIDDEDGVVFSAPAGGGDDIVATVTVTNNTGGSVALCAWMDTTVDGDFSDPGEAQTCQPMATGTNSTTFSWLVSSTLTQNYYSRFRVCSTTAQCNNSSGAVAADDGEVEDYRITYNPTAVTIGNVELKATKVYDFLTSLDVDHMAAAQLLQLLATWSPELAANLSNVTRDMIIAALEKYLDPDNDGQVAVFSWDTLEERGTIGFYVDRQKKGVDAWIRINNDMLPGLINAPMGGEYKLADPEVTTGSYMYRLIEQEARGSQRSYGPYFFSIE